MLLPAKDDVPEFDVFVAEPDLYFLREDPRIEEDDLSSGALSVVVSLCRPKEDKRPRPPVVLEAAEDVDGGLYGGGDNVGMSKGSPGT